MFNAFDKDGDGRISTSEILESLGSEVSPKTLQVAKRIIADLDKDGDGFLDPEEFIQKFVKKQCS
jgi:calcium-binding protein CML